MDMEGHALMITELMDGIPIRQIDPMNMSDSEQDIKILIDMFHMLKMVIPPEDQE